MAIIATLEVERITKGAVRFVDMNTVNYPLSIYLRKEQVQELGLLGKEGESIEITIEAAGE